LNFIGEKEELPPKPHFFEKQIVDVNVKQNYKNVKEKTRRKSLNSE
jgi:hypothetical protein